MPLDQSYGVIPLRHTNKGWEIFLLQHRNGSFWGMPKGHINPGESEREGAARELWEETGLEVESFIDLPPLSENYDYQRGQEVVQKKVVYFFATVAGEIALQKEEVLDGGWYSLEEAISRVTYPEAKKLCTLIKTHLA